MTASAPRSPAPAAGVDVRRLAAELVAVGEVELVRVGSATLYRAGGHALRVEDPGTDPGAVTMMNRISAWVDAEGLATIPVVRTWLVLGLSVTVMPWLESVRAATALETAGVAARLHALAAPSWVSGYDPLAKVPAWRSQVHAAGVPGYVIAAVDAAYDRAREFTLATAADADGATRRLVHGDLHTGNLLVTGAGALVGDWESAGVGDPVWDVARSWHLATRYQGRGPRQWSAWADRYGSAGGVLPEREVLEEHAVVFDLVAGLWCLACSLTDPASYSEEARVRLGWLVGDRTRLWSPL